MDLKGLISEALGLPSDSIAYFVSHELSRLYSDKTTIEIESPDGYSFAYLKELFLSSMIQWIAESGSGKMDAAILNRVYLLREQMNSAAGKKRKKRDGKKKARKAAASRL
jgi:hypothetical protein